MQYVKQYGLKRTGTNWLRFLVEENFEAKVLVDIGGWKHDSPVTYPSWDWRTWYPEWQPDACPIGPLELKRIKSDWENRDIFVLMLVKNPYAWTASMAKYRQLSLPEIGLYPVDFYARVWNAMVSSYDRFIDQGNFDGLVVTYESLLKDAEVALSLVPALRRKFPWRDSSMHFERGNDTQDAGGCMENRLARRKYFEEKEYLEEFTPEQLKVLGEIVDHDLLERYGYQLEGAL